MTTYQPGQSITITADTTLYAVWRGIPGEMTWKIWGGNEHYTYEDQNRITSNLTTLESLISQTFVNSSFETVTRASQFSYFEAQKIEDAIVELAAAVGVSVTMTSDWSVERSISYVDFERWESSAWAVYRAMGGTSERIAA